MKMDKSKINPYYTCAICGSKFRYFQNFKNHIEKHQEGKLLKRWKYKCKYCGEKYRNMANYLEHEKKCKGKEKC